MSQRTSPVCFQFPMAIETLWVPYEEVFSHLVTSQVLQTRSMQQCVVYCLYDFSKYYYTLIVTITEFHSSFLARYMVHPFLSTMWFEFSGNIGGILGLFLGFSWISLVEIVYFLCLKPIIQKRKSVSPSGSIRQITNTFFLLILKMKSFILKYLLICLPFLFASYFLFFYFLFLKL